MLTAWPFGWAWLFCRQWGGKYEGRLSLLDILLREEDEKLIFSFPSLSSHGTKWTHLEFHGPRLFAKGSAPKLWKGGAGTEGQTRPFIKGPRKGGAGPKAATPGAGNF